MLILSLMVASVVMGQFDEAIIGTMMCVGIDMDLNGRPIFGPPTFHQKIAEVYGDEKGEITTK